MTYSESDPACSSYGNSKRCLTAQSCDYRCSKCKAEGLKLWRGVHGATDKDGNVLLCAACLAPGVVVDDQGRYESKYGKTDQVNGWLPAVPIDDTFWGYTSVPEEEVAWWKALSTYKKTR